MSLPQVVLLLFAMTFAACGKKATQFNYFHKKSAPADDFEEEVSLKHPQSPAYGLHASDGWQELPIVIHLHNAWADTQVDSIRAAINTWNDAIGYDVMEVSDERMELPELDGMYQLLDDFVNGIWNILDWDMTRKPQIVLGTTLWENGDASYNTIVTSDILINSRNYYMIDNIDADLIDEQLADSNGCTTSYNNSEDPIVITDEADNEHLSDGDETEADFLPCDVVDLESLMLHEFGHLLGLAHIPPRVDKFSIMNPGLYIGTGMTSRELSEGDIERIRTIYP